MSRGPRDLLWRWFARTETVALAHCVHFCGFRYGCVDYNPYETYLQTVVRDGGTDAARSRFVEFLQHYRPRDFAQALGVELSRRYPLWIYPWSRQASVEAAGEAGWRENSDECPDILTHFSPRGIPRHRIMEEFAWLERALASLRTHGYQPKKFGSYISARKLERSDGMVAWLLLDGNHRAAACSALGEKQVQIKYLPLATVRETRLERWPRVREGDYDLCDARQVLFAHFTGNRYPRTTEEPAPILESVLR